METIYVVEAWNGRRWVKVRGSEGGPWRRRQHAERIAHARQASRRGGLSTTEGRPHRVVERSAA